jgi:hypothetical protein
MVSKQVGQVVPIRKLKAPLILYKYRDYDNKFHKRAINDNEIYIPSANEFNDPLDSKTPFRYKDEDLTEENIFLKALQMAKRNHKSLKEEQYHKIAFENQRKGLLFDEQHIAKFDEADYKQICRDYGIYCLTPNSLNFLMWSYYANSHKGFCIGYSSPNLFDSGLFSMGGQVVYRNNFPKLPLFPTENDHIFLNIFYTKWKIWKHESEYRLVHRYKYDKKGREDIFELPNESIAEIVFGCQFPENERIRLTMLLVEKYPNIKLSRAKLISGEFGLQKEIIYDPQLFIKLN